MILRVLFPHNSTLSGLLLILALLMASTNGFSQRADGLQVEHLTGAGVLPTEPALPFSDAVRVGDIVFLSGMIGNRPGTMELVPGGIEAEARQTMENIAATLEAHGLALADIVKCTVMIEDIAEWSVFNSVYATFFTEPYPARSAFGANGLALGARVEVECVAAFASTRSTLPSLPPAAQPGRPDGAAAGAENEIRAAIVEWVAIYNRNDWSALANEFTEDAVMMPPNSPAVTGRAAIAAWEAENEAGFRIALRPDDISIAGDHAIIHGRSCVFIPLEDGAVGVDIGKILEVRRRQPDGRWLVAQDVFNSDLATGAELAKACPLEIVGEAQ